MKKITTFPAPIGPLPALLAALALALAPAPGAPPILAQSLSPPGPDAPPPEPAEHLPPPPPSLPTADNLEDFVDAMPVSERLADWHERFSSEPHVAGTEGDARLIDKMASYLEALELEVEVHRFKTLLAMPEQARLEIVEAPAPTVDDGVFSGGSPTPLPLELPLREEAIEENPFSRHPDLLPGWNAYSGSGDVRAEVVYANYGTRQDFDRLEALGVEIDGKIVVARYGRNFRGYKAKFAEQAGAVGLIMYTDPADFGYRRGPAYPEGGWANSSYIQRGSILTLDYPGDPLTPFVEAAEEAERLDPAEVALPTIPVQPIGWGPALEILRRMRGTVAPAEWSGGLPLAYRLEGGEELKVRLRVRQKRELRESANVLAMLPGATSPDEWVILGSHHDAWSFGAGDPNSGSILVFEAARAFAAAAAQGFRPARTLVFANWGAEEFGIIGSTEWVEGRRQELLEKAVAYINLDAAGMGSVFRSSASPSLKRVVAEVAQKIPQTGAEEGTTVLDRWRGERPEPSFGNLGGGSDHVGFYCHVGVPSVGLSVGGSEGVSYHSNYEDLHWYRQVVGEDYEGARMLSRLVVRLAARLADEALLPLEPARYGVDMQTHLTALRELAGRNGSTLDLSVFDDLASRAESFAQRADTVDRLVRAAVSEGRMQGDALRSANTLYRHLERRWLFASGLPERPWYRNLFAATDPENGYGAWMLPGLRWVIRRQAEDALPTVVDAYANVLENLHAALDDLVVLIPPDPGDDAQEAGL